MTYLELSFSPLATEAEQSLLIAALLESGFDSFVEEENKLLAYIPSDLYKDDMMTSLAFLRDHPEVIVGVKLMEDKNWNKEWESNYQPVTIASKCYVRAPFHPSLPDIPYEIIIEPKMAFGTAHHETTQLMTAWLLEMDVRGKKVLDMGCGTGILAILANKMGASNVTGIDNDEWAWRNSLDNFSINKVAASEVFHGDASLISQDSFDLVLANINRNVLLKDMKAYYDGLRKEGVLLLSGFYQADVEAIIAAAAGHGLNFQGSRTLNNWAVVLFHK
jgi:ribosomal protein L11 methyltransferase